MRDHMRAQAMRLWHLSNKLAPKFDWKIETEAKEDTENRGEHSVAVVNGQHSQHGAPVLPHTTRVSMSMSESRTGDGTELSPLPSASSNGRVRS